MDSQTITIEEASSRLRISTALIRHLCAAGDLSSSQDGGVLLADVLVLEERQRAIEAFADTTEDLLLAETIREREGGIPVPARPEEL